MALPSVAALSSSSNPADSNSNEGVDAGSSNVRVKEEKPDEAEIREMAARMVEANKQKMANMPPSGGGGSSRGGGGGGQTTLLGYFNRGAQAQQKGATATPKAATAPPDVESDSEADAEKKKPPLDEPSQKGRFGWTTMGTSHIPYIFRTPDEKYCAVRIVETSLLNHYMNFLHADIYSCTCIRSYYITDAEARLFNDINIKHCEGQFGRELFTTKDLVVRLEDAREFYTFLDVCYNKLVRCGNDSKDKCGFIRINGESVVPYTVRDNHKYVPLFYFEGETDNLKLKAEKLENWHLAYLKFCCKVQGIRNELFASETCSVISLSDIRSYFPPGTLFEDYWPNKVVEGQLLVSGGQKGNAHTGMNHAGGMSWIKIPPGSTPPLAAPTPNANAPNTIIVNNKVPASLVRGGAGSVIATSPTVVAANGNAWAGLVGGQPTYQQSAQVRAMQPPISSMHSINHTANNRTVYSRANIAQSTQPQYYPSPHSISQAAQLASQPPPLVRVSGSSHSLGTTGAGSYQGGSSDGGATMLPPPPHLQYQAGAGATGGGPVAKYPPPLIPVNGTSAASAVSRYSSIYQPTGGEVIDLSSPPQSPQQRVVQKAPTAQSAENGMWKKLIPISEHPQTQGSHQPFKIQKALVNEKMVPCINAKPYTNTELLMTLPDLVTNFFPSINHDKCRQVLQEVLKVTLYKGNTQQMRVLHQHQKCKSIDEPLALIQCRDVVCFMPQMKYMFGRMMHADQPVAKRQRLATS